MARARRKTGESKEPPRPLRQDLDDLIFPICEWFFSRDFTMEQISRKVRDELHREGRPASFSRQQVYDAVAWAIERGYVQFYPPYERDLATRLADLNQTPRDRVVVVDARHSNATDLVTSRAAELCLSLIRRRAEAKRREQGKPAVDVHIGLGAGYTSVLFAKHLARILERTPEIPGVSELVFHAMNSGFSVEDPLCCPISYFRYFTASRIRSRFVMLFCPSLVKKSEYDQHLEAIGVRRAFQQAGEIDIVVTSLASHRRESGLLDKIEAEYGIAPNPTHDLRVGDVQFRPFSSAGPLLEDASEYRAVTLFELEDYVRMKGEGKYVILVAGLTQKEETKSDAVLPLLEVESLRVWTHLCLDATTARELVEAQAPGEGDDDDTNLP